MSNLPSSRIRVLVVDDHTLFRRGLIALLMADGRFDVVAEAGDAGVSEDARDLTAALRAGASGYLLKTADSEDLTTAILRTMAGESTISPEMTGKLVSAYQSLQGGNPTGSLAATAAAVDPIHSLSPREREILGHIALGASNKEIARALTIAETTVKIHVQHILRKLNLSSRVQAAVYAAERPDA